MTVAKTKEEGRPAVWLHPGAAVARQGEPASPFVVLDGPSGVGRLQRKSQEDGDGDWAGWCHGTH